MLTKNRTEHAFWIGNPLRSCAGRLRRLRRRRPRMRRPRCAISCYVDAPRHCRRWPRVLPKTKNPYFLENYFTIFRTPPTPNALKLMKSRIFFTIFGKLLKFWWVFIKTNTKNVEFDMKCWFFRRNQQNFIRIFAIRTEFRPVRRNVHFVDLEKCCKMSI